MTSILGRNFLISFLEQLVLNVPDSVSAKQALSVAKNMLSHDGATCAADCQSGEALADDWLIIEGDGCVWYLCPSHKQAAIAPLCPERPGCYGSGVWGTGVYGDTGASLPVEEN